jgi:uncharacterized phosphosugar-binding protein
MEKISVLSYSKIALPHLEKAIEKNEAVMNRIAQRLLEDVQAGKSLLVFGSGHSAIFPMEMYHRAGGASFVIPLVAEYLLPSAGPPVVRILERTAGTANVLLSRFEPKAGEMIWISSQSGINATVVDFAIEAKKRGLHTVAFTSVAHSSAVPARHSSGKKLFEVCDEVVDFGGFVGDASVKISPDLSAGPLSTLTSVLLGHSIITAASAELEARGVRCIYTSVNTPDGETRNKVLEDVAKKRDYLLR